MIGIAYNPEASVPVVQDFVRRFGVNFPVGYRDTVTVNAYLQLSPLMRNYVPNLVVIDRRWTIRGQYAGDDPFLNNEDKNLRAQIDALLAEKPAARKTAAPKKKK